MPTLERKGKVAAAQISTRKRTIYARSLNQDAYMRALDRAELVFGIGPAGTGKTYLAVAHAAMLLERGMVERIILSRPAVEAGERLGFLPGDMKEKVDPYLRPLYDALYDMMPADKVERAIAAEVIEIAPLAFMRGRTLAHAAVILDEAQNTTLDADEDVPDPPGRELAHDRHRRSDPDRPAAATRTSGLVEALRILDGVPGVVTVRFNDSDVVRHPLVAEIVRAYDRDGKIARGLGGPKADRLTDVMENTAEIGAAALPVEIDLMVEAGAWPGEDALEALARRAVAAALAETGATAPTGTELSLVFSDDAHIQALNAEWRGKDKPTNVLSFPAFPTEPGAPLPPMLGDIVLAAETVAREAALEGKPREHHITHLVIHGFLHLMGYDHETDAEAEEMEGLERRALARLAIPDPYA